MALVPDLLAAGDGRASTVAVHLGRVHRADLGPAGGSSSIAVKPPLVLVRWTDAWFDFDQGDDEDPREAYPVSTVGFLVRDGERFVSLAQELLPDGDGFRAITHIPRAVVDEIVPLRTEEANVGNDPRAPQARELRQAAAR